MDTNFSVLISVYHKEKAKYLEKSLESIYDKQILKPNEIVLVKDGPLTKELDDVINNYKEKHPNILKVIALKENVGLGNALNIGVNHCSNEIIARMDSDDISREDRFFKQIKIIKEKNVDIVGSYVEEFIDNIENVVSLRKVPTRKEDIIKYSKKRNPFSHPSVMFKKQSVLASGGYQESYLSEDYNLWVRMIINKCICQNIDEALVYMRIDKNFYKRRGGVKYLKEMLKFKYHLYKIKYINLFEFLHVSIAHIFVCLIPNNLRNFVYQKLLRG